MAVGTSGTDMSSATVVEDGASCWVGDIAVGALNKSNITSTNKWLHTFGF